MKIQYLEVVTNEVEAMCAKYSAFHQVEFSEPTQELGNARVADLEHGGRIGVRAPMHDQEPLEIRPYWLVKDAQIALDAVMAKGATMAHPAMQIPGQGTFALYVLDGIMQGFWQLD